jgi:hypothetical protein
MQIVNVVRDLLFQGVGDQLLQLGTGLGGQLGFGHQNIGARYQDADPAPGTARSSQ